MKRPPMATKAAMRVGTRWYATEGRISLLAEHVDTELHLPEVVDKLEDIRTTTIDPAIEALATEALRLLEGE